MRLLKFLLVIIFTVSAAPDTQAQILKKLKKKIEKGVEQTVIEKTNDKVQHEASKSMDKMLEGAMSGNNGMAGRGEMVNLEQVPESYAFSYTYTLEMKDEKRNEATAMDMYLEPDAPYWGMQMQEAKEMKMVYDAAKSLMVMYMDQNDQKMAMAFKSEMSDLMEEEEQEAFEVREIPGKEIMGYNCQGFEVETADYLVTIYNTFEAEVSLANVFGMNKDLPDNFDPKWIKKDGKYGLMMEMYMKDKSDKGEDVSMRCTDLTKNEMEINKSDYQGVVMPQNKQ